MSKHIIISIIFAYLLLWISGCINSNVSNPSNELIYPGSQEIHSYDNFLFLTSQFQSFHVYLVKNASPSQIIDWYKDKFSSDELEINNISVQGLNVISLLIVDKGLNIISFNQNKETIYIIGKLKESEEDNNSLPDHDLVNGDEPIPRYPGSVMLSYEAKRHEEYNMPLVYRITYGTKDSYKKVADWYKSLSNWELKESSASKGFISLLFENGDDRLNVMISSPEVSREPFTEIDVEYDVYKLPNHDLESGKEYIPRYPGSVMLKYYGSSYNGAESTAIYGTYDKIDKVKDWYINELKSLFSNVYYEGDSESSFPSEFRLEAAGKNIIIRVEILGLVNYTRIEVSHNP